ncbi:MAG: helix-turn-helix domain-containing protein [Muribaculaceae bacterium]|nr:helix-turn-helix domain-containing protein [Muribaculaceae bacterium]
MSSDVLEKFASKLKKLREEKHLSQEALALMSNINRTYVGRIENLKRTPSLVILDKIAKGLDMELHELLKF